MTEKTFKQMRKILILIAILCVQININAQEPTSAKNLLRQMPESVIPVLTHNNVLDMLDFTGVGQKAEVTNRLNGKSEMTELSESSAAIKLSSTTRVNIHLMTRADNETMIYVINTTETADSLRDSEVKVYDSKWHPAAPGFKIPNYHPQCFNEVVIDPHTKKMTLTETQRSLCFEGESQDKTNDTINTRHAEWDARKGVFTFKD